MGISFCYLHLSYLTSVTVPSLGSFLPLRSVTKAHCLHDSLSPVLICTLGHHCLRMRQGYWVPVVLIFLFPPSLHSILHSLYLFIFWFQLCALALGTGTRSTPNITKQTPAAHLTGSLNCDHRVKWTCLARLGE